MSYSIRPEEHELSEARNIVTGVLETCEAVKQKDSSYQVQLGWDNFTHGGSDFEEEVFIGFNTEEEDWKDGLKTTTAYSYAQSLFWELFDGEISYKWQEILLDGFSLLFVEEVLPDLAEQEVGELEPGDVENWENLKEELGDETGPQEPEMPWQINYLVAKKLVEDRDLEDIPGLKKSDVVEAGDELFG